MSSSNKAVRRAVRDLVNIHPEDRQQPLPPTKWHGRGRGRGSYSRNQARNEARKLSDDTLVR